MDGQGRRSGLKLVDVGAQTSECRRRHAAARECVDEHAYDVQLEVYAGQHSTHLNGCLVIRTHRLTVGIPALSEVWISLIRE